MLNAQSNITVVVAGRNSDQWLEETIGSVLQQTVRPEIIYVDDGSNDISVMVARRFDGVRVIEQSHQGVVVARNAGLAATATEYVLFLDADDQLPPHFLAEKVKTLEGSGADFVYSPAQCFGNRCFSWPVPDWSHTALWASSNYVNTSAFYRTRDLISLGGWRENLAGTAWDWDLALRMVRACKRGVPERTAPLLYRQHAGSLSQLELQHDPERLAFMVLSGLAKTAICCVYGGRLNILDRWLEAAAASIDEWKRRLLAEKPYHEFSQPAIADPDLLVLATNGERQKLWRELDRNASHFGNISVVCEQWDMTHQDEYERRHKVCHNLAGGYNRLIQLTDAEIIWTIEDDILVPPNAMADLQRALLWQPKLAVSGIYRNRHETEQILGADWPNPPDISGIRYRSDVDADTWCDLAGTGCLMYNRVLAPHKFAPLCHGVQAHDWNWSLRLRDSPAEIRGPKRVLLLSGVRCPHYQTDTESV